VTPPDDQTLAAARERMRDLFRTIKKRGKLANAFFFGRSFHRQLLLRRQLSLPTVANSGGKLAKSFWQD
jgi:hypothetical protein